MGVGDKEGHVEPQKPLENTLITLKLDTSFVLLNFRAPIVCSHDQLSAYVVDNISPVTLLTPIFAS